MYDLEKLRTREFPMSNHWAYFNNASIAPLPQCAKAKAQWATENLSNQPTAFWNGEGATMRKAFGDEIATYINATSSQEIVPITSTSAGINSVAQAIEWQPGDNVLFCGVEFPANVYPWMSLRRDGVEVRQVPVASGGLTLPGLKPLVDRRTRLVATSAVQFFTGHRTDLAAIGSFCRKRGIIFVVDAIQAIGHMRIDVQAMNIDVLVTGGQKSLLALPGIGFMFVRDVIAKTLHPRCIGGNATESLHWLAYDLTPAPSAYRFKSGTPNLIGMFVVLESIRLLEKLQVGRIDQYTRRLVAESLDRLTSLGYQIITPHTDHGSIVTFKTKYGNGETDALVTYLQQQKVCVTKLLDAHAEPHVRLSFHCYNSAEELARFFDILIDWP